jgi:serine/threonine protein kinase
VLAGRYELGRQLGRGGMATVYEAHDELLDRAVAVKLLRVVDQANARERFAAEARNAAKLTHPHAVGVYDVSVSTERPFIVMELVRGETLEDVLARDGSLDTRSVVAIGCQVLAALHAAHRRGLVHRDVKPANILLPDGKVPAQADELPGIKLADFGIAKAMHDATVGLTMAGQVIGTPKYLSPEQVRGQRATPRSDIYATAVVLFEMLAGRAPFEQDSAVGLALAHREDEPPPLGKLRPDLDPALVALVHRALAKDPEQRPADANEMRLALLGATPAPSGPKRPPSRRSRLRPSTTPARGVGRRVNRGPSDCCGRSCSGSSSPCSASCSHSAWATRRRRPTTPPPASRRPPTPVSRRPRPVTTSSRRSRASRRRRPTLRRRRTRTRHRRTPPRLCRNPNPPDDREGSCARPRRVEHGPCPTVLPGPASVSG